MQATVLAPGSAERMGGVACAGQSSGPGRENKGCRHSEAVGWSGGGKWWEKHKWKDWTERRG